MCLFGVLDAPPLSADVRTLFNSVKVDNAKELYFNEFLAATLGRRELDERRLRLAFDRLDFDHSGTIDGKTAALLCCRFLFIAALDLSPGVCFVGHSIFSRRAVCRAIGPSV